MDVCVGGRMLGVVLYECMYLAKGADVGGCCICMYISSEGGRMFGVVVCGCMCLLKGGGCWGLLYMGVCILRRGGCWGVVYVCI